MADRMASFSKTRLVADRIAGAPKPLLCPCNVHAMDTCPGTMPHACPGTIPVFKPTSDPLKFLPKFLLAPKAQVVVSRVVPQPMSLGPPGDSKTSLLRILDMITWVT